jgi:hypothetical protein
MPKEVALLLAAIFEHGMTGTEDGILGMLLLHTAIQEIVRLICGFYIELPHMHIYYRNGIARTDIAFPCKVAF